MSYATIRDIVENTLSDHDKHRKIPTSAPESIDSKSPERTGIPRLQAGERS
jgi:hypothetical protein